jgi:flagellar hook-associated protein 2
MTTVAFSGLATGLDTASIVSQLVELRRRPIYRLENRRTDFQNQLAALSTLKEKLLTLQKAAARLDSAAEFNSLQATSSDEDRLRVTAGTGAASGVYDIVIESLATARRDMSQGYDSAAADVGAGTLLFVVGGTNVNLTVEPGTTLSALKDRINDEVDGISATIVNDGSPTGGHYLILRGTEPGTAGNYAVNATGLTGGQAPVFTVQQSAADASLTVDGLSVTAAGNQVSDVISGLTLDLLQAAPGETIRVSVERDPTEITGKVKELVDAYNDLFMFVQEQSQPEGDLRGNPTLRSAADRIENIFTAATVGGPGGISLLAQVGITRGDARQLEWDEDKFAAALVDDFSGVRDLFVEKVGNPGKSYLIQTAVDNMTDSVTGLFKISNDALNNKIRSADQSIERYERSIESYRLTLERQFAAMEMMVAQLQAQGSYLSSVFYR